MPHTLADWISHINALPVHAIDLGLSRIKALAQAFSLSQFSCPVVMVGGTNGKGSTVKFLETIYWSAGYRVAAYTSPHLMRVNERLRLDAEEVSDEALIMAFNYIEQHRGSQLLTFFEFTTLAIFYICQQLPLDILILEVGLGGRLDAVNIVDADIAVITSIALDHTDWLGDTREAIAKEKVGIARAHKPLVCGDTDPPQTIMDAVLSQNIPFYCLNKRFSMRKQAHYWDWMGPDISYLRLPLPTLKVENAAISLMVVELLQSRLPVTQFAVISGVKKATLNGRFEVVQQSVPIIFDVAHNPQATTYLASQLTQLPVGGKTLAVVGMLNDKDIEACLQSLLSCVDGWYAADLDAETPRGAKSSRVTNYLATKSEKNCYNFASVGAALLSAMADSGPSDRIVVFGSFYTVALAKRHLVCENKMERNDGS